MWIKKALKSLYASIVLRMTVAVLIACFVTMVLMLATSQYSLVQNKNFWQENDTEIKNFATKIEALIDAENLTFKETIEYPFPAMDTTEPIRVSFYSKYSDIFDEIDYLYEIEMLSEGYFFEFDFSDGTGFMVVYSEEIETETDFLILLSIIVGVTLFFVLSLYLILKKLSYIRVIEQGICHISHGDIQYKIPLIGENELTRLAGSINEMGDLLTKNIEQEREYEANQRLLITNMSHDLKTPLTSMNGYIDVIQSKLTPDHEAYPLIVTAKKNGQRLEKLIADLFLYSKLISNDVAIHLQKININVMVKQIVEIRTESITLQEMDTQLMVMIDPEKFHRIVDNLISNAAKHGIIDAPITIIMGMQEDKVKVHIKNFTADDLTGSVEKLTNRLYTAHEDRHNGSSGLGLSIVTELLKAMDGDLHLDYHDKVFTATLYLPKI